MFFTNETNITLSSVTPDSKTDSLIQSRIGKLGGD